MAIRRFSVAGAVGWTLVVLISIAWNLHDARRAAEEMARTEARVSFNKDIAYRHWVIRHGGVYVPVTSSTQPNPYLTHVAERDIQTPSGRALTLVNSSYMTRQVHELARTEFGARGHITSLNPLRPENGADPWEAAALRAMAAGKKEVSEFVTLEGKPYLRLMGPMWTDASCLKCHGQQGYKEGDLRGGISVAVAWAPYRAVMLGQALPLALGHGVIWAIGMALIGLSATHLQRRIRERLRAEEALRESEEKLRQAQKMEAVGRLAGGVAHDFNNLLQVINGYTDLALSRLAPESPACASLEEVARAGYRAATLVSQLLAFSRRQVLRLERLDMNEVIGEALKMLRRVIGEHIQVVFKAGEGLGAIHADRGQMEQVLMNLCVNARDAMPSGGTLTIETRDETLDAAACAAHSGLAPGRHVMLVFSDTGCGMDVRTLQRIWEPFFTTKAAGQGTGLGLATTYGIIQQHKGAIRACSEPGRGTAMTIYLPVSEGPVESGTKAEGIAPRGGTETILLAEDEAGVREFMTGVLRGAGYTVLAADDGEDALRLVAAHGGRIDLALLDCIMPGLGGRAVSERLKARHPAMRFLFVSGYSTEAISGENSPGAGCDFLQKPFAPGVLLAKVREILDRGKERAGR